MVDNEYTMVGFLPVCCSEDDVEEEEGGEGDDMSFNGIRSSTTVQMKGGVHVTADLKRREKWTGFLHEALKVVVRPLQECKLKAFVVKPGEVKKWRCVPQLVLYCCDIPNGMNMSAR